MKPEKNPHQLVVEDVDLKGAVIGLMRHHSKGWPLKGATGAPVYVRDEQGVENALNTDFLRTMWQMPGLRALGLIVDADVSFAARWSSLKRFADAEALNPPEQMPAEGLVLEHSDGRRFGAWIMPNNADAGMLESFCEYMLPQEQTALWNFAQQMVTEARNHGADYVAAHEYKARIRTWLAWRDPPGQQIGVAITRKILDPNANSAAAFIAWFRRLYALQE